MVQIVNIRTFKSEWFRFDFLLSTELLPWVKCRVMVREDFHPIERNYNDFIAFLFLPKDELLLRYNHNEQEYRPVK